MADFVSVVGPYEAQYPDLLFLQSLDTPDVVGVIVKNPANDKEAETYMPVPFVQETFDNKMDQAINSVL